MNKIYQFSRKSLGVVGNSGSLPEKLSTAAACHDAGVAGAPMTGNKSQWKSRQAKGYETLVNSVWNGMNGMPAKGLCIDCTKEEIEIAVQYMLDVI